MGWSLMHFTRQRGADGRLVVHRGLWADKGGHIPLIRVLSLQFLQMALMRLSKPSLRMGMSAV